MSAFVLRRSGISALRRGDALRGPAVTSDSAAGPPFAVRVPLAAMALAAPLGAGPLLGAGPARVGLAVSPVRTDLEG